MDAADPAGTADPVGTADAVGTGVHSTAWSGSAAAVSAAPGSARRSTDATDSTGSPAGSRPSSEKASVPAGSSRTRRVRAPVAVSYTHLDV
ncbi:hypothetical protein [Streptomyces fragilis]|uniref:hypothetical protein n=1 Tax=Streptomyces fragilis TaxID=67301 RepID=UPI0024DE8325|nr:hypothetical protein [Streptomyces fragilis]